MKKVTKYFTIFSLGLLFGPKNGLAQNPLILDQFTADPSARVFNGRVYLYPSHDVKSGTNWFCMKDYHVFSSENLTEWTDHGVIIAQEKVAWVDSATNSLWAPDCIEKGGKYYFYFPAIARDKSGMRTGVAVSDAPGGPFIPNAEYIPGVSGIDPNPFIDKDGQAYLYWAGMGGLQMAKLNADMLGLESEPRKIEGMPEGMKEGPYLFERNGVYYFTFPHVIKKTEALVYATGASPLGPFEYKGVIMDEFPSGCWTNHQSILKYKDQWYLFYHHNDLSPGFDKNRSARADSLFFNEDGTIQKVIPTLRGVGLADAGKKIEIDRYSAISEIGASVDFLDTLNVHRGWKTTFKTKDSWIRFNCVDFGEKKWKTIHVNAASETGGSVKIRMDQADGPIVARISIPPNGEWSIVKSEVSEIPSGVHDLIVILDGDQSVGIDWIYFEKP